MWSLRVRRASRSDLATRLEVPGRGGSSRSTSDATTSDDWWAPWLRRWLTPAGARVPILLTVAPSRATFSALARLVFWVKEQCAAAQVWSPRREGRLSDGG